MKIPKQLVKAALKLAGSLSQEQDHHNPVKTVHPGMPELLRQAAAQGAVLLENRVLPLEEGCRVSVFGRVQNDWFYTGYGSGGDVNSPYKVSLMEGLRSCPRLRVNETLAGVYADFSRQQPVEEGVWGMWPTSHPEMPLTPELVEQARRDSDQAILVIGRSSGEDRDCAAQPGSYYLTEQERQMLAQVTAVFPEAVLLLNIGTVMDLSFLEEYPLGAVLVLWQGGMESGNAAADLLCGNCSPGGCLTDTIPKSYQEHPSAACFGDADANEYREDIYVGYRWFQTFAPEKVRYPFGYGLTYTTFARECLQQALRFRVTVTNTGNFPARDTVQLYVEKPCGILGNPSRELAAFAKTDLLEPGQRQTLELEASGLESFDDSGLTGHKNCWVRQPGLYRFYLGGDVAAAREVGSWQCPSLEVVRRLTEAAAPREAFPILALQERDGQVFRVPRRAATATVDLKQRILDQLPPAIFQTGDKGIRLADVQAGRAGLEAFVAQLSLEELEAITRGGYIMGHPLGARGNAGIFAGVTGSLRAKGVPVLTTTDGPSGLRLYDACSLLPIGTALACSFDTALMERLHTAVAGEMKAKGSDILLSPGMNIHRNPLCGRNFEYFSEDPYLTGKLAAAAVRGIQSGGLSACPKHFACNNQEYRRHRNDSRVSARALREIYLRGFEICVKEAAPKNIMTSYNKINGVWGHYHYDLVTTVLRGEWGYRGNVITDWWMQSARSPEFPKLRDNAYRVRAQVDVLMPGGKRIDPLKRPDGTLTQSLGKAGGITLGEIQRCAMNVLRCAMELKEL